MATMADTITATMPEASMAMGPDTNPVPTPATITGVRVSEDRTWRASVRTEDK